MEWYIPLLAGEIQDLPCSVVEVGKIIDQGREESAVEILGIRMIYLPHF